MTKSRGPIIEKIKIAKSLLQVQKGMLLREDFIGSHLPKLRAVIEARERERIRVGIASECARCGTLGRDCCGQGIELRYSKELILINLLLGTELPDQELDKGSCYFLTPKGCCLAVRDVFCVNFLCRTITDRISPAKLSYLRELEGKMLDITFRLEERIKLCLPLAKGTNRHR